MRKIQEYITNAYKNNWALGQYNMSSLEVLQGSVSAAEELNSPIIIGTSMGTINHFGLEYIKTMVNEAKRQSEVPVYVHLDHGTYDMAIRCIECGYDSVMIDASRENFDDNIRIVSEIVTLGHHHGVEVEGQIGRTLEEDGASSGLDVVDTNPLEAVEFVSRTGVDYVAVQIGNIPGQKGRADIDLSTLEEIYENVKIPIVLHGGSSVPDETIRRVKKLGIAKVNIDRILRDAVGDAQKSYYSQSRELVDPRKPMDYARELVKKAVIEKIILFGSLNMAMDVTNK